MHHFKGVVSDDRVAQPETLAGDMGWDDLARPKCEEAALNAFHLHHAYGAAGGICGEKFAKEAGISGQVR